MVHCQACSITTAARNHGITFHRFPKNEIEKRAWIDFVKSEKKLPEDFKYTMLCSQHFDQSCFDRTSAVKVRLKPHSEPTIHVSRSKYEKICPKVTATTDHSKMKSICETSLIDATATNIVTDSTITDAATMDYNSDMNNLQMDTSQPIERVNVGIETESSNRNVDVGSLPFSSSSTFDCVKDVPLEVLPSDTPKKCILKKKISSLGRSLAVKSNFIRKLQKQNWNQKKQIFKLKSVINELGKFGPNEQLINRLFKKTVKGTFKKQYQEEIRKCWTTIHCKIT